jgi:hypothetical protein
MLRQGEEPLCFFSPCCLQVVFIYAKIGIKVSLWAYSKLATFVHHPIILSASHFIIEDNDSVVIWKPFQLLSTRTSVVFTSAIIRHLG